MHMFTICLASFDMLSAIITSSWCQQLSFAAEQTANQQAQQAATAASSLSPPTAGNDAATAGTYAKKCGILLLQVMFNICSTAPSETAAYDMHSKLCYHIFESSSMHAHKQHAVHSYSCSQFGGGKANALSFWPFRPLHDGL